MMADMGTDDVVEQMRINEAKVTVDGGCGPTGK